MKPYKINIPQYHIVGKNGEHFDVFNKRENAIKKAIKLAINYPNFNFQVIKRVNLKDKVIFSLNFGMNMDLTDIKIIYSALSDVSSEKIEEVRFWRI